MLAKVIDMIEQDEYCPDIVQQVDSVCGFLRSMKQELLADHLATCAENPDKKTVKNELLKIYHLSDE